MKASSGRHPLFLSTPIEGVLDASRSSRPPRSSPVSSSPASGVAKVVESVTRSGHSAHSRLLDWVLPVMQFSHIQLTPCPLLLYAVFV